MDGLRTILGDNTSAELKLKAELKSVGLFNQHAASTATILNTASRIYMSLEFRNTQPDLCENNMDFPGNVMINQTWVILNLD